MGPVPETLRGPRHGRERKRTSPVRSNVAVPGPTGRSSRKPEGRQEELVKGTLSLLPEDTQIKIYDNGAFKITSNIEEGRKVEDLSERLDFTHDDGSYQLSLKDAYESYLKGEESELIKATPHTRDSGVMTIRDYTEGKEQ